MKANNTMKADKIKCTLIALFVCLFGWHAQANNSKSQNCAAGNVVVGGTDGCPVQNVPCNNVDPKIAEGSGDYVQPKDPKGCGGAKVKCGPLKVVQVTPAE